jgi:hypothetical protein
MKLMVTNLIREAIQTVEPFTEQINNYFQLLNPISMTVLLQNKEVRFIILIFKSTFNFFPSQIVIQL